VLFLVQGEGNDTQSKMLCDSRKGKHPTTLLSSGAIHAPTESILNVDMNISWNTATFLSLADNVILNEIGFKVMPRKSVLFY